MHKCQYAFMVELNWRQEPEIEDCGAVARRAAPRTGAVNGRWRKRRLGTIKLSRARFAISCAAVIGGALSAGCPAGAGAQASVRAAVAAGLIAAEGNRLTLDQVHTFWTHQGDSWAVAYDPAIPAGCNPGGLTNDTPGGIPDRPCFAYVLHRRKSTWELKAKGYPGDLDLPDGVPIKLGDRAKLAYLAP
jgi:hypothetical protein